MSEWKAGVLEKVKLLEGISRKEWERLKKVVDETFENQEREIKRELKLSSDMAEKTTQSSLF